MAQTLEHNEVVTQVVPITVPSCDVDVTVIQQLDDEPNDVGGLTAAELKAKFDETNAAVKSYINDELIPAVVGADATEQARSAAEAERVANEIERVSNETTRVNAETTRGNNETARQSAETTRGNNETARQSAETTRGNNETTRVNNEAARQNNEAARQNNEAARVLAEAARENAETGYVAQCATSAQDAANSATAAGNSATAASNSETAAGNSATAASNSATAAGNSAMNAATSESNAAASEAAASESETAAGNSATAAGNSAKNAATSERNAEASAEDAEAWAVGKRGGVNVGESDPAYHNNALYWKEQAQQAAGGGVTSFKGRAGSVVPQEGDYTAGMVGAIPVNEKGAAGGVASLGSDGKVPSTQLPSLDYIPTSQKGAAGGVASLGADGKVPGAQLPSLDYIPTSQKGAASGVASLGADGKVPSAQLPEMGAEAYTATLTTSGWVQSGSRYAQTVNVTGVTASTPVVLVDVALSGADIDADAAALEAWGIVSANNVAQGDGTLTFYALSVPSVNVPVNVGVC